MPIVNKSFYRPRLIDRTIDEYLAVCGAVCIEGPKWCGKSWTSSYHSNSEFEVSAPDNNFQNRALAAMAPTLVLEGESPRLIDEWQEVPPLWDAVRATVDKRGKPGQFLLTGSSTPNHKGVLHSGIGRIAKLRMRTMSLYESGDSTGDISLKNLCCGKSESKLTGEVSLVHLAELIVRGGFPGNLVSDSQSMTILPRAYINAILEDDVRSVDGIDYDTQKIALLLRSLARNETTLASKKSLARDMLSREGETLNPETVTNYLNLLTRMFLIDNQAPFSPNCCSALRLRQAEKRHLADPALSCALLNLTPDKLIHDLETFGFMFEAMVERDLRVYAQSFGAEVYHYKDYADNEIDAVVEMEDGSWSAFEVKLGFNQVDKAAAELIKIRRLLEAAGVAPPTAMCVICGMSTASYQRPDGVFVVPITALKN